MDICTKIKYFTPEAATKVLEIQRKEGMTAVYKCTVCHGSVWHLTGGGKLVHQKKKFKKYTINDRVVKPETERTLRIFHNTQPATDQEVHEFIADLTEPAKAGYRPEGRGKFYVYEADYTPIPKLYENLVGLSYDELKEANIKVVARSVELYEILGINNRQYRNGKKALKNIPTEHIDKRFAEMIYLGYARVRIDVALAQTKPRKLRRRKKKSRRKQTKRG